MIPWLPTNELVFPHPKMKAAEGILAVGGDLSSERIITAYLHGIFPWYNEDEPILWWFLAPRLILIPEKIKISKSMRNIINRNVFRCTVNQAFDQVINACSGILRPGQSDTWIHPDMRLAYSNLHELGVAWSVETWMNGELVGGLYGLNLGKIFFGESMFARESNASKFALIYLAQKLYREGYMFLDCQQDTPHLRTLGAELMGEDDFLMSLRKNRKIYLAGLLKNA